VNFTFSWNIVNFAVFILRRFSSSLGVKMTSGSAQARMIELSDIEIQQLKEQNQKRIKRVVTVVAISLTLISVILVALSLSLGPKIDQLVSESLDGKLSSKDLFLNPQNESEIVENLNSN